ncbi:hypothetical protein AB0P21_38420 [Kribbella sp. NPDC056861]|uniref:hypothetical protein n=1 Tax=Kribbella sp. NPDC056861 TaxID=3154857 RepID=UPI00343A3FCA
MRDGGRIAARGFQYQYLRTLEYLLDALSNPQISAIRIEGPVPAASTDTVDFDLLDQQGDSRVAVQVKSKAPHLTTSGPEVLATLIDLISVHQAHEYHLLSNSRPDRFAQLLSDELPYRGSDATTIRQRLADLAAAAPRRLAQLDALSDAQMLRFARSHVRFDPRDRQEISDGLRERIREYREQHRAGLGHQSAGLLTGYLIAEVLRRSGDASESTITVRDFRAALAVDSKTLARTIGVRDWGVIVGQMPQPPDVARVDLLKKIRTMLTRQRSLPQRVSLIGPSGIGKSSLAAGYLCDSADSYDLIAWVDAETPALLEQSFRGIAVHLGGWTHEVVYEIPADAIRDYVHVELSRMVGRWALVFDNVLPDRILESWIPNHGSGHIFLTSVDSQSNLGAAHKLKVGRMTTEQAITLLATRLDLGRDIPPQGLGALERLTDTLEGWPLALELAAGYMSSCNLDITEIDSYIDIILARAVSDSSVVPPGYPSTLTAALALCLDQLMHTTTADGELRPSALLAVNMLERTAFLASSQIPVHLLLGAVVLGPGATPIPDGPSGPIYLIPEEMPLPEIVRELLKFSLIEYDTKLPPTSLGAAPPDAYQSIKVNSVVQDFLRRAALRRPNLAERLTRLSLHLNRWFTSALELNEVQRALIISSHAQAFVEYTSNTDTDVTERANLIGNLAGSYRARGDEARAEQYLLREIALLSENAPAGEILVAQSKYMLAEMFFGSSELVLTTESDAVLHLEAILGYALKIALEHPNAAAKLAIDARELLRRPQAIQLSNSHLQGLEEAFSSILSQIGPTGYTRAIDSIRSASTLISSGKDDDAESTCRTALASDALTGTSRLVCQRLLIEALAGQKKWSEATLETVTLIQTLGPSGTLDPIFVDLVHNLALPCIFAGLSEGTMQAKELLGILTESPRFASAINGASSATRNRLLLMSAFHHLMSSRSADAETILLRISVESLHDITAAENIGWSAAHGICHLALFERALY